MSSSSSKTKPFSRSAGDWTCPNKSCGNLNFARRDQCNRCDAVKPNSGGGGGGSSRSSSGHRGDSADKKYNAIGNAVAKSSKGLFSPEDWSCLKCGNINWARRSTCNICNAKKFADEERTGYGGGYNERANVEYKDRPSSDSEYDEFGRRKKKKSRQADNDRKAVSSKSSRETRRSRSRSRSKSSRSSSSSSSDRDRRRKRSRRSPSPKRGRRRRRSSSSSSSSESSRERHSKRSSKPTEDHSKKKTTKEKSPPKVSRDEDEEEDEESGSDEDLSKYDLFDDDFDVESFKKDNSKLAS